MQALDVFLGCRDLLEPGVQLFVLAVRQLVFLIPRFLSCKKPLFYSRLFVASVFGFLVKFASEFMDFFLRFKNRLLADRFCLFLCIFDQADDRLFGSAYLLLCDVLAIQIPNPGPCRQTNNTGEDGPYCCVHETSSTSFSSLSMIVISTLPNLKYSFSSSCFYLYSLIQSRALVN